MDVQLEGISLFISMLLVGILLGQWLHHTRFKYATEGSIALMVGLFAGGCYTLYYALFTSGVPKRIITFDSKVFFNFLLPPIIFNAGFSVKKRLFFQNFATLILFGMLGTLISAGIISYGTWMVLNEFNFSRRLLLYNSIALGIVFSSTDSVATLQILDKEAMPILYSLVFGEGVVNDATSVVLLKAAQGIGTKEQLSWEALRSLFAQFGWLFFSSLVLGVVVGLASAFLIRRLFKEHSTDREMFLVGLMGFSAYILAELLDLSGIFSVFFCGITMSHYTWHSLSPSARVITIYMFRTLSYVTETLMFIYAGFDMWTTTLWNNETYAKVQTLGKVAALAMYLLGIVLVSRALFIGPLCLLANLWRVRKLTWQEGVAIWWSGTMRGAITIALTYHHFLDGPATIFGPPKVERQMMMMASVVVVLMTTIGFGILTKPFLTLLFPSTLHFATDYIPAGVPSTPNGGWFAGEPLLPERDQEEPEDLQGRPKRVTIHRIWQAFDHAYMQPIFGGRKTSHHQDCDPPSPHSPGGPMQQCISGALLRPPTDIPFLARLDESQPNHTRHTSRLIGTTLVFEDGSR